MKLCKCCFKEFKEYNRAETRCPACKIEIKRKKDETVVWRLNKIRDVERRDRKAKEAKRRRTTNVSGLNRSVSKKMASVSNGIAKETTHHKEESRILSKIKAEKIARLGKRCESCGEYGEVDLSHLCPKSTFPELVTDERILVLHGAERFGTCLCHTHFEANNYAEIRKFNNFFEIMLRIREAKEGYYWTLVHKFKEQKQQLKLKSNV